MKNLLKLFLCVVAIWVFVKITPVLLSRITSYQQVIQKSEILGIDNSALFYSEELLTSKAEQELNERLEIYKKQNSKDK